VVKPSQLFCFFCYPKEGFGSLAKEQQWILIINDWIPDQVRNDGYGIVIVNYLDSPVKPGNDN
jgi:hypothetical protein